jgi:glutathione S-transferase
MRRLVHLLMSPACRLVRLALTEKRIPVTLQASSDPLAHLPVLMELDGSTLTGLWAIMDHLEALQPDPPLFPEDPVERAEALRLLDYLMGTFNEEVSRRILYQKAAQAHTGSPLRQSPDMQVLRAGRAGLRAALQTLGRLADEHGFLAARDLSIADLAAAAHLSALDYFGEVPFAEFQPLAEWYARIKSRPAFRTLLGDRVPGQPPVAKYADLDF